MALHTSAKCKAGAHRVTPAGPEVVAVRGEFDCTTLIPALNDVIELVPLPPETVLVDAVLDCDDLDSATAMVMDVGVLNTIKDGMAAGGTLISASNIGQTGGVVRATAKESFRVAASSVERSVGVKVTTAAGTKVAGKIGLTVFYKAQ